MKETGRVVGLDGGNALVYFRRTSMCAKCGACGMGSTQDDITVEVANRLEARVGDEVEVQFTSRRALTSSAIGYLFPLLMLFAGILTGYLVPPPAGLIPDAVAAIFGLVFVAAAFVILKLLNPVFARHFSNTYTMTQILPGITPE